MKKNTIIHRKTNEEAKETVGEFIKDMHKGTEVKDKKIKFWLIN